MMGLIQGIPTKKDAALAAEATRESWQALLDRLSALAQAKSLPERQNLRNDVLGAIHVHMSRRSYENRINWQIERDEIFQAIQDASADPAAIVERLRAMLAKPEAPSAPIPPMSTPPAVEKEAPIAKTAEPKLSTPNSGAPKVGGVVPGIITKIEVKSRQPEYAIHRVSGTWEGHIDEARKLIEEDLRANYPFGGREIRISSDGSFSYVGHTD